MYSTVIRLALGNSTAEFQKSMYNVIMQYLAGILVLLKLMNVIQDIKNILSEKVSGI